MTKQQLIEWAKAHGWSEDRYGHLQKVNANGTYRMKLSSVAVRYEVKGGGDLGWIRLRSGYFSRLSVVEGKLTGMKV